MLNIYIISLKTDIERRNIIADQLNKLGVSFEFIDAVCGKELPCEVFSKLSPQGKSLLTGAGPTKGEVGCTLSHLKVYELMLQRKEPWACILEDDVVVDWRLKDFYDHFKDISLNKESLYLMGGQNGIFANIFVARSFFSSIKVGQQLFTKIINSESYVCRTCCYLISDNVASKILDLSRFLFLLADDWEYLVRNNIIKNIYLADFVDHPIDLSSSSIEKERQEVRSKVKLSMRKKSLLERLIRYGIYKVKIYTRVVMTQFYRFKR